MRRACRQHAQRAGREPISEQEGADKEVPGRGTSTGRKTTTGRTAQSRQGTASNEVVRRPENSGDPRAGRAPHNRQHDACASGDARKRRRTGARPKEDTPCRESAMQAAGAAARPMASEDVERSTPRGQVPGTGRHEDRANGPRQVTIVHSRGSKGLVPPATREVARGAKREAQGVKKAEQGRAEHATHQRREADEEVGRNAEPERPLMQTATERRGLRNRDEGSRARRPEQDDHATGSRNGSLERTTTEACGRVMGTGPRRAE